MDKITVNLSIGFKTDIGRVRDMNQDSLAVMRRAEMDEVFDALLIVADGMGGGRGGEVASRIVTETLPDVLHEYLADRNGSSRSPDPARLMQSGIVRANTLVCNKQMERKDLRGMGTTCVAALLSGDTLTIGNAGDSRAYLLRDGKLSQITEDHSEVWQQVKAGQMTREEASRSKFRNRVTNGIGLTAEVTPDIDTVELKEGDTVLLCSDGLTTEVNDPEIARILATVPGAQEACNRLVETALRNGGSDNVTVIILRYGTFTPLATAEAAPVVREVVPLLLNDDEDITDPEPDWRKPAKPLKSIAEVNFQEEDEEEMYEPPRRRSSRRDEEDLEAEAASGGGGFALAMIITLLMAVAALGVSLWLALNNRTITPPLPPSQTAVNVETLDLRTDKELIYDGPEVLYPKPVREGFLLLDPQENLIVATLEGKLIKVTPKGQGTPLTGPALPAVTEDKSKGNEEKPKRTLQPLITYDASGNRYQANPDVKNIYKYDALGTRKLADIGLNSLKGASAMVINRNADIYVIDDHRLKKITAYESIGQLRTDKEQKKSTGAEISTP